MHIERIADLLNVFSSALACFPLKVFFISAKRSTTVGTPISKCTITQQPLQQSVDSEEGAIWDWTIIGKMNSIIYFSKCALFAFVKKKKNAIFDINCFFIMNFTCFIPICHQLYSLWFCGNPLMNCQSCFFLLYFQACCFVLFNMGCVMFSILYINVIVVLMICELKLSLSLKEISKKKQQVQYHSLSDELSLNTV